MIYYYANSGHKIGLERVRRGVAYLSRLAVQGHETMMLVNDFRAGLLAKELGLKDYVTIESIQDIDAIAQPTDSIIIDSTEDDHGRMVKYFSDFKNLWRFEHTAEDRSIHGEILIRVDTKDEESPFAVVVADTYFEEKSKEERTIFFLGDADYDKIILNNADFFKSYPMELILGNYFFVKYENDLEKIFSTLHEPEEYDDLITESTCVVTASAQTALEAKVSGAKVIFLEIKDEQLYPSDLLNAYGISVVKGFDEEALKSALENENEKKTLIIEKFDDSKISTKL